MRIGFAAVLVVLVACDKGGARSANETADAAPSKPRIPDPTLVVAGVRPIDEVLPGAVGTGPLGIATQTARVLSAHDGRWVTFCQARTDVDGDGRVLVRFGEEGQLYGDGMQRYLAIEGGAGALIDEVLAVSRDQRLLLVRRGGDLLVVDTLAASAAPVALEGAAGAHPRYAARFSGDGRALAYARDGAIAVATAAGVRHAALPGEIVDSIESVGHRWVQVVSWKPPDRPIESGRDPGGCADRLGPYSDPHTVWVDMETGQVTADPAKLAPIGDGWLERTRKGALTLGGETVVPESCKPAILAVRVAAPWRVVYVCPGDAEPPPIRMAGDDLEPVTTAIAAGPPRLDERLRVLEDAAYCLGGSCLRLDDGATGIASGEVLAYHDSRSLVSDGATLFAVESMSGERRPIDTEFRRDFELQSRTVIVSGGTVVDFGAARELGAPPQVERAEKLAVDARGRMLVPASFDWERKWVGPLRWVDPAPR